MKKKIVGPQPIKRIVSNLDYIMNISDYKPLAGVYFLFQDEKLMYIGQSKNVHNRIANHASNPYNDWKFNEAFCLPIDRADDRLDHETKYIRKFRPEINRKYY